MRQLNQQAGGYSFSCGYKSTIPIIKKNRNLYGPIILSPSEHILPPSLGSVFLETETVGAVFLSNSGYKINDCHKKKLILFNRYLLEKLTAAQLLEKFSACYATERFITLFKITRLQPTPIISSRVRVTIDAGLD
jgi:hypothetical protein